MSIWVSQVKHDYIIHDECDVKLIYLITLIYSILKCFYKKIGKIYNECISYS